MVLVIAFVVLICFQVWNDVFMSRADLPRGYGGWQVGQKVFQVCCTSGVSRRHFCIFLFWLLSAHPIPCLFVTKTALQAIDATPQEKSNSKITPLNMIMIMNIILVITMIMKENSNVVLPPWQPSRWG